MYPLTPEQLAELKAIDTPTICNAIEKFKVRGRVEGFMGMDIRCLLPELGVMVGYAVTVTVDSTVEGAPLDTRAWFNWMKAMEAAPKPVVVVFKDISDNPRHSAHLGEVMATIAARLGVVGVVTDGGLRDILEVKQVGLQCFAKGLVPSHGNPRLIEVNVPVTVDGVRIEPGDLLHGDANGVTAIPRAIADQVAKAALEVRSEEAGLLAYIRSSEFKPEEYFRRRFTH
jgi:4-hydroxy-4-methyl-2-oxoglutarate aldolase